MIMVGVLTLFCYWCKDMESYSGALLRIPADSPDSDLLTSARNKTLLREKCVLHPGMTGWESWEKDLNKKG